MAAGAMMAYYAIWYPKMWLPNFLDPRWNTLPRPLDEHMRYAASASKRLARFTFHQMMRYQKKMESKQSLLNRIVDVGTEIFTMAATCSFAEAQKRAGLSNAVDLADGFCRESRCRIEQYFRENGHSHDKMNLKIAKRVLAREYEWLENEIIK